MHSNNPFARDLVSARIRRVIWPIIRAIPIRNPWVAIGRMGALNRLPALILGVLMLFNASVPLLAATLVAAPPIPVISAEAHVAANTDGHSASISPIGGASYVWSITGGVIVAGNGTPAVTYSAGAAGTLRLSCAVTDASGTSTGSLNITVDAVPEATIYAASPVTAGATGLRASVADQHGATYVWSISGGTITAGAGTNLVTYTAGAQGTIELACTITKGPGLTASASSRVAVIGAPAISSLSAAKSVLTQGQSTTIVPVFSGGQGVMEPGLGPVQSGQAISVSPTITSTYTLIVTNAAGTSVSQGLQLRVVAPPKAEITAASPVTTGATNRLARVDPVSGSTYAWSMTGGTINTGASTSSVNYTAGAPGTASLRVTVTNEAGTSLDGTTSVSVIPEATIATFTATPATVAPGSPATLTATFAGGTAVIDRGVGPVTSGQAVTVNPVSTTTYTVTVTNPAGSSVTRSVTVNVAQPPSAVITAPGPVTTGTAYCSASVPSVGGGTYQWTLSGGTILSGATNSTLYYTAGTAGTATLTCKVTAASGASAAGTSQVTVLPAPSITSLAASATTVPQGQSVTLTPTFSGGTGVLNQGIGPVLSGQSVTVQPTASTTYTLRVTNGADTSVATSRTISVTAASSPAILAQGPLTAGATNYSAYVSAPAGSTFVWSITGGTITSGGTSNTAYFSAGTGTSLTLTCAVTTSGVTTTINTTLQIIPAPVIDGFIASPTTTAPGGNATLTGTFRNGTGSLSQGLGGVTSGQGISVAPTTTTTYTLTATNAAGSQVSRTVTVNVDKPPIATITAASPVSVGSTLNVASVPAQSGATYVWSIQGGSITSGATGNSIQYSAGPQGILVLTCTVTNGAGIPDTGTANITVLPLPAIASFDAAPNPIASGAGASLRATYAGGQGVVDQGVGPLPSGVDVIVAPRTSTTYQLTVTSAAGSTAQRSVMVSVPGTPSATITTTSPVTAFASNLQASVAIQSGCTYAWSIQGGVISSGATSNAVVFSAGGVGVVTLTCIVTNEAGVSATNSIQIPVVDPPSIGFFKASALQVAAGGKVQLTAQFQGGYGVITPGIGSILSGQTIEVIPGATTDYVLTVTNSAGTSTTSRQTVTAVPLQIAILPDTTVLPVGMTQGFLTTTNGAGEVPILWKVLETGGGSVNAFGAYTAPDLAGVFHVRASAVADATKTALATVTVPLQVKVEPEYVEMGPGESIGFMGSVLGSSDQSLLWSCTGGVIGSTGHFTAPAAPGTYTVVATRLNSQVKGTAVIVVRPDAVSVTLTPSSAQVAPGGTMQFSANVEGTSNNAVTWGASGGTIDAGGQFTAPATYGTYTIQAASVADPAIKDEATVVVSTGSIDRAFTYDANGNLINDGQRTFEWDAENRLVAVNILATGHRSDFGYDGLGRRVEIVEKDPDATQTLQVIIDQKYLWDGVEIAEQRDSTGATVQKRFYDQGFVDTDGTLLTYTRDHLGSIRELTDSTQVVRARYDYDPYGRPTKVGGDRDSLFGYANMVWHAASRLEFAFYRAYDPNLGRWISRDPIQETGGLNLYVYCSNNVVNKSDVLGLCKSNISEVIRCLFDARDQLIKQLTRAMEDWDTSYQRYRRDYDNAFMSFAAIVVGCTAAVVPLIFAGCVFLAGLNLIKEINNLNDALFDAERKLRRSWQDAWDEFGKVIKECELCDQPCKQKMKGGA